MTLLIILFSAISLRSEILTSLNRDFDWSTLSELNTCRYIADGHTTDGMTGNLRISDKEFCQNEGSNTPSVVFGEIWKLEATTQRRSDPKRSLSGMDKESPHLGVGTPGSLLDSNNLAFKRLGSTCDIPKLVFGDTHQEATSDLLASLEIEKRHTQDYLSYWRFGFLEYLENRRFFDAIRMLIITDQYKLASVDICRDQLFYMLAKNADIYTILEVIGSLPIEFLLRASKGSLEQVIERMIEEDFSREAMELASLADIHGSKLESSRVWSFGTGWNMREFSEDQGNFGNPASARGKSHSESSLLDTSSKLIGFGGDVSEEVENQSIVFNGRFERIRDKNQELNVEFHRSKNYSVEEAARLSDFSEILRSSIYDELRNN